MARELAFALINPYTIAKSRTGGVIARFIARTQLDLVGARMFGPSQKLATEYADLLASNAHISPTYQLLADYVRRHYGPNQQTGKRRRVMMLLFEGENAVEKVSRVTGSATMPYGSGETIRDTYGDYVLDAQGKVVYFEPAVLVAPNPERAALTLRLWARYTEGDGGIVTTAWDVPEGEKVERTLVLLKPDNFRFHSARPGSIIDILSTSGLRIVAARRLRMTVAQAEAFYEPVLASLRDKFEFIGTRRATDALAREFGFTVPEAPVRELCRQLGPDFAAAQFESIVEFMTGYRPGACTAREKSARAKETCLAIAYEGINAVNIIRNILGPTDPSKASPGSVRREFGSNIMVNAAHASDSVENARREMNIVNFAEDDIRPLIESYYGGVMSKILNLQSSIPRAGTRFMQRLAGKYKTARPAA